ncbi:Hypothetical predicted protein [Paramuricea clavata]|uniref:Uncharacterized protein n=1 Tax=Paramuricea clavata TaxID=317549 RepID=A0A6S7JNU4_PARCT|nr:Hypothetical predicted protein [Paramuricea clavata]
MNSNQLITTPTRLTDTSESLITSTSHLVNENGVMDTTKSDHLPVYAVLYTKQPKPPPQYILMRSCKDYDDERFTAQLASRSEELVSIFSDSNVNSKLDKFNNVLLTTLAVHAPVRIIKKPFLSLYHHRYKKPNAPQRSTPPSLQTNTRCRRLESI